MASHAGKYLDGAAAEGEEKQAAVVSRRTDQKAELHE
jgi:hypothetical protein